MCILCADIIVIQRRDYIYVTFTSWVQNIRLEGTGHIGNYQYSNKKIRLKWLSKLQENNERKNTPGVLILSEKLSLS